ncbi:ESPR-type extended signal peptide-containing protein, partial [Acinetobacter rudis]|uniref:ESPR-type extended signal peptide-containing protein n=1 Tax=Acinetobacter rudis TaxID=632955 RepID=UPI000ADDD5D1
MNKIYRVIWNASLGAWVAVSELAKSKGKRSSSSAVIGETAVVNVNSQKNGINVFLKPLSAAILMISSPMAFAYTAGNGTAPGSGAIAISDSTCSAATAGELRSIALGCGASATTSGSTGTPGGSIAVGDRATSHNGGVAIGQNSLANSGDDKGGVAIGSNTQAYAYGVAIGEGAISDQAGVDLAKGTVAIGTKSHVDNADGGVAIGNRSKVGSGATNSMSLGLEANVNANITAGMAVGAQSSVSKSNAVALGAKSNTDLSATSETQATVGVLTYGGFKGQAASAGDQVSLGSAGKERQIKNLAAGKIAVDSTDGVNGSQLFATNTVLGNVASTTKNVLGGTAALNPNGSLTMTDIGGTGKNTIDEAIKASKTVVKQGANTTVTYDAATNSYTVNASAGTTGSLTFAGNSGSKVKQLGETMTIKGTGAKTDDQYSGQNIKTMVDTDGNLVVAMDKNLAGLESVSVGNTVINNTGLTINNGPSITTGGINAGDKVIGKVADGVAGKDAVNVDQLNAAKTKVVAGTHTTVEFDPITNTYKVNADGDQTHYVSVNDGGTQGGNYNNDGATGISAVAIGIDAKASGSWSVALGEGANAIGSGVVALGSESKAEGFRSTAVGNFAQSLGEYSLALGSEAIAFSPLSIAIGHSSQAIGDSALTIGGNAVTENSIAIGLRSLAWLGKEVTVVGTDSGAYGDNTVAVGYNAVVDDNAHNSTAVGSRSFVKENKTGSSVFGRNATSDAVDGSAVGFDTLVTAEGGMALGAKSVADRAATGTSGQVYIGQNASAADQLAVNNTKATTGAVSVGGLHKAKDGTETIVRRQITNLAAGLEDTDAVNVAQLKETANTVTTELTNKGLKFAGNSGTPVAKKLGETMNIKGSG